MIFAGPSSNSNASVGKNFDDFVNNIIPEFDEHIQRFGKQLNLAIALYVRNNYDQAIVEIALEVLPEEVASVVGRDDVVILKRELNNVPVLPSTFADVEVRIRRLRPSPLRPRQARRSGIRR